MDLNLANQIIIEKIIKPRMEERGLTMYQLAQISGVSRSSIGRWFNGEMNITLNNFMKIISALEINLQLLYKETDTQSVYPSFTVCNRSHSVGLIF